MLSACMIVQDEEDLIARAISSVHEAVDEVIVLDGGSVDKTKEIAKGFAKVRLHDHPFPGDFAQQRNLADSYASGDWILSLDADEYLEESEVAKLSQLIAKAEDERINAYRVNNKTYIDGGFCGETNIVRLYRKREDIWVNALSEVVDIEASDSGLVIVHDKTSQMQEIDNRRYWSLGQPPDKYAIKTERGWYRREVDDFRLTIVVFHKVGNYGDSAIAVTRYMFNRWLIEMLEKDYQFVLLEDIYGHRCGGKPLPAKPIVLTFDDCYECLWENVYPILRRFSVKANAFVITSAVGNGNEWDVPPEQPCQHATWEQIRKMQDLVSFQSHSHTHRNFTELSKADILEELQSSKSILEDRLNKPVQFFSYPYGCYDNVIKAQVIAAGYVGAVALGDGINDVASEMFALSRFNCAGETLWQE
jgi:peptidoglycan/xylan/chitin deacetylase (PgdA/CDA1 family)